MQEHILRAEHRADELIILAFGTDKERNDKLLTRIAFLLAKDGYSVVHQLAKEEPQTDFLRVPYVEIAGS